jgi:putative protease
MKEQEIGYVSKYFGQIKVAAIEITAGKLSVGETIHIKGHTTDMNVDVGSIQIEHESVDSANKGDSIGLKVSGKARRKDKVFKLSE